MPDQDLSCINYVLYIPHTTKRTITIYIEKTVLVRRGHNLCKGPSIHTSCIPKGKEKIGSHIQVPVLGYIICKDTANKTAGNASTTER